MSVIGFNTKTAGDATVNTLKSSHTHTLIHLDEIKSDISILTVCWRKMGILIYVINNGKFDEFLL